MMKVKGGMMHVCIFCGRQIAEGWFECGKCRKPEKHTQPPRGKIFKKIEERILSHGIAGSTDVWTAAFVAGEKGTAFQRLRRFGLVREMNFPHYRLTKKEMAQELGSLFKYGPAKITDGEIEQTMHAQGFCWSYHPHSWEVRCGDMPSPMEVFMDDKMLMKVLDMRAYNGSVSSLTDSEVRKGLKAVTQGVSNFRPTAAWAVYERYCQEHATVYDPSMGWGGRLLGAVGCHKVLKYVGCDPSTKTFEGLKQMEADLRRMVPYRFDLASFPHLPPNFEGSFEDFNMQIDMRMKGSEDFRPEPGSVDLAFTSPPYFEGNGIVESYSDEPTQSHIKFPTREAWKEGFIGQTIRNCYVALNRNATRLRCKSYLTDTHSFDRQLHYLRYSQLFELYARIGQQCPVLFQGSTVEDARAREVLGEDGLPTLISAQIESRVTGYLQAQNLMQTFLLSPFGDRDRATDTFYVQHAVEWIRKTNRFDQFIAFDAKSVDEGLAWVAATPEREKQVRQKAREAAAKNAEVFRAGVNGIGYPACFYMPNPPISDEARKAKYRGAVQAEAVVTVDGRVTEPKVLKSPGMGLDETVVETLRTWRCKPATGPDGHPVATLVPIEISFQTY